LAVLKSGVYHFKLHYPSARPGAVKPNPSAVFVAMEQKMTQDVMDLLYL
jgi:hypothetical protein